MSRRQGALLVVVVLVLAALVAWLWPSATPGAGKGGGRWGAGLPSVVSVAKATMGDVPVTFTALGTVIPNQMVTVTSRVEGQLRQVYFKEGQFVEKGQLLAQIDPRPYEATLAQYQASLKQNQALLKSAKQALARSRTLYEQRSLARQELEAQIAEVGQYAGAVNADQARIQAAQLDLDYTRITAPISGYAGLRLTDPGNLMQAGDSTGIVTITQTDPVAVTFSLPQGDLDAVLPGLQQGREMPVWALTQLGGETLARGVLRFISNQIDIATGTIELKALFDNPERQLYPNQAVRVRLQTRVLEGAVLVPQRAVQLSNEGRYVWVVKDDNTVEKRAIVTGLASGDNVVVESGLKLGEAVVTQGVDRLDDGDTVKIGNAQDA